MGGSGFPLSITINMRNTYIFENPGKRRPRLERNLLYSTEFNVPLRAEGNGQIVVQRQSKYGRTDEEILRHIISNTQVYNKIL
jgi:hypothetical protein